MDKLIAFFSKIKTKEFWISVFNSLVWLMVLIFIIDIITKWVVQVNLGKDPLVPIKVFGDSDFLVITLSHNMGASFGMLSDGSIAQRVFWISVSVILSGVLTFFYIKQFKKLSKAYRVALALMITGAYGNMIDRVFYWKDLVGFDGVIDWISFSIFPPIFNIADASLVIGAFILIILFIIELIKDGVEKGKRGEYKYSPKEIEEMLKKEKENKDSKEVTEESKVSEETPNKENEEKKDE